MPEEEKTNAPAAAEPVPTRPEPLSPRQTEDPLAGSSIDTEDPLAGSSIDTEAVRAKLRARYH